MSFWFEAISKNYLITQVTQVLVSIVPLFRLRLISREGGMFEHFRRNVVSLANTKYSDGVFAYFLSCSKK
ncbi:hypothetical protein BKI52_15275 [marine bacterium AO1-C]|nr:hypothetical protein BKI52_15275 [marine bacterium AO1-C]